MESGFIGFKLLIRWFTTNYRLFYLFLKFFLKLHIFFSHSTFLLLHIVAVLKIVIKSKCQNAHFSLFLTGLILIRTVSYTANISNLTSIKYWKCLNWKIWLCFFNCLNRRNIVMLFNFCSYFQMDFWVFWLLRS